MDQWRGLENKGGGVFSWMKFLSSLCSIPRYIFLLRIILIWLKDWAEHVSFSDHCSRHCKNLFLIFSILLTLVFIPNAYETDMQTWHIQDLLLVSVNGGWSTWSQWTPCSVSCGKGLQRRHRTCSNPTPLGGGLDCEGEEIQRSVCNSICPGNAISPISGWANLVCGMKVEDLWGKPLGICIWASSRLWHFLSSVNSFLQTCMRSHPVGLDIWFLVRPFIYFHISFVRTAKALARLHGCAGSPEPSLVAYLISTIISWAGSFNPLGPSCPIKGTQANSADPDQMPQNAAFDQGLHCLHTQIPIKNRIKMKKYTSLPLIEKWTHPIYKDGLVH